MIDCEQKELHPEYTNICKDGLCPKPCCEPEWPIEDLHWAIVNSYKYLYVAEKRMLCSYDNLLGKLQYGYACDAAAEDSIDKAKLLRDTVKREIKRYKHSVKCLCKDEITTVFENIERLEKCKLAATHVQTETDEDWVKRNLLCASREDWEMYATALCALFTLQVQVSRLEDCAVDVQVQKLAESKDTECNIAFEITKSQQFCDFIISLSLIKRVCDMGLKFDVDKHQCNIEWKLLLEKNPTCNINLKTYIECKEQGITYDLIELLISAGLDLQTRDGELFLLGLLQEYKLSELSFSGVPAETTETRSFYSNPKAFVEKYLKDYHISDLTIQKILKK